MSTYHGRGQRSTVCVNEDGLLFNGLFDSGREEITLLNQPLTYYCVIHEININWIHILDRH